MVAVEQDLCHLQGPTVFYLTVSQGCQIVLIATSCYTSNHPLPSCLETVYVCVHMPKECVCERKDVHSYCSRCWQLSKKDYALAASSSKWRAESFLLAPRRQWLVAWRIDNEICVLTKFIVALYGLAHLSARCCQPLDEVLPFALENSICGDDEGSEIRAALPASFLVFILLCSCQAVKNCCHVAVDIHV